MTTGRVVNEPAEIQERLVMDGAAFTGA